VCSSSAQSIVTSTSSSAITGVATAITDNVSARASTSSVISSPDGRKITSTITSPCHALYNHSSGGRSVRIPADATASSAASASSGLTITSRSFCGCGPPRAHAATLPPSMNGTPRSRSAATVTLSVSTRLWKASLWRIALWNYPHAGN
jgi:hypothetical protein